MRRQAGFTYLGLIVLVAIIGLVGAATLKVDALLHRAAAERELLEIGAAFRTALKSYADATPRGQPQQPPSLQELLKDPRFPGVRRHLRKIFVDPITGMAEWGILWVNRNSRTGVLAVYSLSQARPLKQANFDARFQNLDNKRHLSDWKFAATGQAIMQAVQASQQGVPAQDQAWGPNSTPSMATVDGDQNMQAADEARSLFPEHANASPTPSNWPSKSGERPRGSDGDNEVAPRPLTK